jgi:hypothetical protein
VFRYRIVTALHSLWLPNLAILDSDGLITAAKQSNKPKHTQNDEGHATRLFSWKNGRAAHGSVLAKDRHFFD